MVQIQRHRVATAYTVAAAAVERQQVLALQRLGRAEVHCMGLAVAVAQIIRQTPPVVLVDSGVLTRLAEVVLLALLKQVGPMAIATPKGWETAVVVAVVAVVARPQSLEEMGDTRRRWGWKW